MFPNIESEFYERNVMTFLHPIQAQMLSFFDGDNSLEDCINSISSLFSISHEKVESILLNYIENKNSFNIESNGVYFYFPKYILIEKNNYIRDELYHVEDFAVKNKLDFSTTRLFKPLKLIIETNLNCYTDCIYCYADKKNPNATKLMPWDSMERIIRDAKASNIPSIELNGGEVLMYPHIDKLLNCLSHNGYHPFISTKIPIQLDQILNLNRLGFKNIQISIDTLDEIELIERLHVNKGYLSSILNTMRLLDQYKFCWQVNVVITKSNADVEKHIAPLICKLATFRYLKTLVSGKNS